MKNGRSLTTIFHDNSLSRRSFVRGMSYTGLTALGASSILAACGGDSGADESSKPAPKGSKVSGALTLVYMGTAEQQKSWNALFELFRKDYPDVKFTAKGIPSSNWAAFFDTVSTQIAGGQVPDVIQVATEGQRLFASRGLVEPIDAYLARDKDELADFFSDIHPNLVKWNKMSSPDGKTYYLPGEFNTMCMWYNADMFQKVGVDEPNDSWKWDDFMAAAKKLTVPGKVFGYVAAPEYFASIMPWLLTNGASTLNADWTKSTVNTPQAVEAAKFMRSMVEQQISPAPGGTFDAFTATAQGKLAMFGGGRWPVISMRNLNMVSKMKIVAWPQKTQKGSPIGWNAYPIMKASKNKEAAWAFVKFITSKKASEYFSQQGGTIVPPRKSVATSDVFLANAPAGSEKLYEALEYSTPIPSPDKGNLVQKDIEDTWKQLLSGNVPVEQALAQLDQKIQANL
ncbi:sugar ABC transporter substrate-binding protein [Reticulibacter mediterranei]|uniref:Sugar ABC transporter substrate-binding protein n=1 Tax=Reticulibacter mediterranei TaxID=2778369 RepID=A0A8J3N785_9CHLR|nr:sugar ABC transporter substrate-binding protein [Reticulibacter mediterranei]GHO96887.1 sugar ABC transporter substrate-binding protein [Reticulibacter mediterranei]